MFGFKRASPPPPPEPAPPTPAPLIQSIDEVLFYRDTIRLRGWAFCPGRQVTRMALRARDGDTAILDGYGTPSPDVAAAHGSVHPEAEACRFSCAARWSSADTITGATLVFALDDGTVREMGGLVPAPTPLRASVNGAHWVRGRLHLAGWAFCPGQPIVGAALLHPDGGRTELASDGLPSPDVLAFHPEDEEAANCRFDFDAPLADPTEIPALRLVFTLGDDSTREVTGLEQTPTPLQWSPGQVHSIRGELHLDGWAFCPGHEIMDMSLVQANGEQVGVENFGLSSLDVATFHPDEPEAARCRFALRTPLADPAELPALRLVFTLDDGTTREAVGLEQTPVALVWSPGQVHFLRGELSLDGWAFCPGRQIAAAVLIHPGGEQAVVKNLGLPSPDVAQLHTDESEATHCRFTVKTALADPAEIPALRVVFSLDDGTTREISGLEQTAVPLLWSPGQVHFLRGKLVLDGWAFCPGHQIVAAEMRQADGGRTFMENHGLPSPDVAQLHPDESEAARCRFTLTAPLDSAKDIPGLRLVFTLDDGTTREVGGLEQTPVPLLWSPGQVHHLRGCLYLDGWAFCPGRAIVRAALFQPNGTHLDFDAPDLPSPDVAAFHPDDPEAARCRFTLTAPLDSAKDIPGLRLVFTLDDGTTREVGGLEQTPVPLLWSPGQVHHLRGCLYLDGWAFCPGRAIVEAMLVHSDGAQTRIDDFHLPSPDVAALHPDESEAARCRFTLISPLADATEIPKLRLVFNLDDGTTREAGNLRETPMPLRWSSGQVYHLRGELHLDGWAFCPGREITKLVLVQADGAQTTVTELGLPSPDVAQLHPDETEAARCRFTLRAALADPAEIPGLRLVFTLDDGTFREAGDLEQTPVPLLWSQGQVYHLRGELHLDGWAFCPGREITKLVLVQADGAQTTVTELGLPSPDVAQLHPDETEAARCRFTLRAALADPAEIPSLRLIFTLDDGATREAGELIQTPVPLQWSASEASVLRGHLHLAVWAFCPGREIVRAGLVRPDGAYADFDEQGLPSPDVALLHPDEPEAACCRFSLDMPLADPAEIPALRLVFTLDDGTTREARGLAQTPVGLLWSASRVNCVRGKLILDGWAFCPGRQITGALLIRADGERVRINDHGLPSPDVAPLHRDEPEAAHCRFTLTTPLADSSEIPSLRFLFTLDDGTERAFGGIVQTPTPLFWAAKEVSRVRGRLYLSGWAFCPGRCIVKAGVRKADGEFVQCDEMDVASPDVAALHPDEPEALRCGFAVATLLPDAEEIPALRLAFTLDDGTTREVNGLEQTPVAVRWSAGQVNFLRGELYVAGWAFCPGQRIVREGLRRVDGRFVEFNASGLPSPDVAGLQLDEPEAMNCRFTLRTRLTDPAEIPELRLVFEVNDGRTVEVSGLKLTPMPLQWSAGQANWIRGELRLVGWAYCPGQEIVRGGLVFTDGTSLDFDAFGLPSPDVVEIHPEAPEAARCGFELRAPLATAAGLPALRLRFALGDGTTREVQGMELTPTRLRWSTVHAYILRGELHLVGWAFCPGHRVTAGWLARSDGSRMALDALNLPSPDVEPLHPADPEAAACRFGLTTPMADASELAGMSLVFALDNGTTREAAGLKSTPVPLSWSASQVNVLHGELHLAVWAFCLDRKIVQAELLRADETRQHFDEGGLPSPDVVELHPEEPEAGHCRYFLRTPLADPTEVPSLRLLFTLDDHTTREVDGLELTAVALQWSVNTVSYYRGFVHVNGWALCSGRHIVAMGARRPSGAFVELKGFGLPSKDVLELYPEEPEAACCGFNLALPLADPEEALALKLVFTLDDGSTREASHLLGSRLAEDPYHVLQQRFFDLLKEQRTGTVLEVGSRARSGNVRRELLPDGFKYVGMDILAGENVDVVGDAHLLSETFAPRSFDAVFSVSVFEHLLMPWKAVLEIGKVLRVGGLVMIATHQSFPLHETPWDFFRFSDQAWHGLFNAATGFEIVRTALGEPVSVVPHLLHKTMIGLEGVPAFIGSVVLARKVGESSLRWDVDIESLVDTMYPH